jgi:predicted site-specific integrase-resolvase
MTKAYSTLQVAKLISVTSDTLHRWIRECRIEAPPIQSLGGMKVRLWSQEEVDKVRKYKAEKYRKKPRRKNRK